MYVFQILILSQISYSYLFYLSLQTSKRTLSKLKDMKSPPETEDKQKSKFLFPKGEQQTNHSPPIAFFIFVAELVDRGFCLLM